MVNKDDDTDLTNPQPQRSALISPFNLSLRFTLKIFLNIPATSICLITSKICALYGGQHNLENWVATLYLQLREHGCTGA